MLPSRVRAGAAAVLVGVLASTTLASTPSYAEPAPSPLLVAKDAHPDVRFTKQPGLADQQRRSIELRKLTVTEAGRDIRFTVRMRRVVRSEKFVQFFFLNFGPFDNSGTHPEGQAVIGPRRKHRDVVLEWVENSPEGYAACDKLDASLRHGAQTWHVDIPRRCVPEQPVKLSLLATVRETPVGRTQWSRDRLRVPGRHVLGGTAS